MYINTAEMLDVPVQCLRTPNNWSQFRFGLNQNISSSNVVYVCNQQNLAQLNWHGVRCANVRGFQTTSGATTS